jgi:hypothetical protein
MFGIATPTCFQFVPHIEVMILPSVLDQHGIKYNVVRCQMKETILKMKKMSFSTREHTAVADLHDAPVEDEQHQRTLTATTTTLRREKVQIVEELAHSGREHRKALRRQSRETRRAAENLVLYRRQNAVLSGRVMRKQEASDQLREDIQLVRELEERMATTGRIRREAYVLFRTATGRQRCGM